MKDLYFKISYFYKKIAKYIFSFLIVIAPAMTIYSSPIPKVSLFEFFFILFVIFTLIFDLKKYRLTTSLIPFLAVIAINVIYVVWNNNDRTLLDDVGTSARLLFTYFLLFVFANDYFSYKFSLKVLVVAAFIFSVYGLIQEVLSFAHIYLYNYIPLLPEFPGDAGNTYQALIDAGKYGFVFRMRSIFREPAHFATYIIVPAILLLFKEKRTVISVVLSFFFFGVAIASLSSLGIIISVGALSVYFVIAIIKNELKPYQIAIIIAVLVIGIILFIVLGGWDYFVNKTFKDDKFINILNDSRLSVFPLLRDFTIPQFIFGHGLSQTVYMSTYVLSIYGTGIIGLFGLSTSIGLFFSNVEKRSSLALLIAFIIMNVGSEIAFGAFTFPFIAFIIKDEEEIVALTKKIQF